MSANHAGVSKGTLYVYFKHKEQLFEAIVEQECEAQAEGIFDLDHNDHDVEAVLTRLGIAYVKFLCGPEKAAAIRTVIAIADRTNRCGEAAHPEGAALRPKSWGTQRRMVTRIKGQKYTSLSRKENLSLEGKKALKMLLAANKRLNTAYVLKESFGQLWSYEREGWARRFFENWRASLKWQRLKPYEKFAEMIDRHWGRHRRLLPAGEQGLARLRRGAQQQDPRDPAPRLRLA